MEFEDRNSSIERQLKEKEKETANNRRGQLNQ